MVAAFRENIPDPQLPFRHWSQAPAYFSQSAQADSPPADRQSAPSFTYAEPDASADAHPWSGVRWESAQQSALQRSSIIRLPTQINPPIRPTLAKGAIASTSISSAISSRPSPQIRAALASVVLAPPSQLDHPRSSPIITKPTITKPTITKPTTTKPTLSLSTQDSYPKWLQWFMLGQRSMGVITLTLVGIALSLYGQSVYQQRQWGQSYNRLENLQKLEQQGVAASEMIKHSLAEEAEHPDSGMISPMPETIISIEKVSPRPLNPVTTTAPRLDLELNGPIGY